MMNVAVFFLKLQTVFLSRKDFFNSKGVGLERKAIKTPTSFENFKLALICTLILLIGILCNSSSLVIEPSAKKNYKLVSHMTSPSSVLLSDLKLKIFAASYRHGPRSPVYASNRPSLP